MFAILEAQCNGVQPVVLALKPISRVTSQYTYDDVLLRVTALLVLPSNKVEGRTMRSGDVIASCDEHHARTG
jgi:hypothetical protein